MKSHRAKIVVYKGNNLGKRPSITVDWEREEQRSNKAVSEGNNEEKLPSIEGEKPKKIRKERKRMVQSKIELG